MVRATTRPNAATEIEAQLAKVKLDHDNLAREVLKLRARQRRLAAEMRTLEAHLALARDPASGEMAALQSGTLGDAISSLLERGGQPVRIVDLVHELQAAGKLLRTDWAYSTVAKALSRDPRFERVPGRRGHWHLR
jgi:hypothetical protein